MTIAHQINTILDYDRALVLDQREMVEYDPPAVLLGRKDGWFAKLCRSATQCRMLERAMKNKVREKIQTLEVLIDD